MAGGGGADGPGMVALGLCWAGACWGWVVVRVVVVLGVLPCVELYAVRHLPFASSLSGRRGYFGCGFQFGLVWFEGKYIGGFGSERGARAVGPWLVLCWIIFGVFGGGEVKVVSRRLWGKVCHSCCVCFLFLVSVLF